MAQATAYECDVCRKLTKDIVTVVIDSDKHNFTFGEQRVQPHLVLSVCIRCLPEVGRVVSRALLD
jgi:hypothetical protein